MYKREKLIVVLVVCSPRGRMTLAAAVAARSLQRRHRERMVEDLTGDGGVCKQVLRAAPDGAGHPPHGARVWIHYVGKLENGTVFDSSRGRGQPLEFKLGVGELISAYDVGVKRMRQGEIALITCRSDYGYGWEGSPPKIPKDASLSFEVELVGWVEKTLEDMNDAEKLQHAQGVRVQGTALFGEQQWGDARAKFAEGIEHLQALSESASKQTDAQEALLSCLLNQAQCCLKLGEWGGAADACTRALALQPDSAKALYRRGMARTELLQYAEAKADLLHACKLEPKSRQIREEFERTKVAHAEAKLADRAAFGGFLGP